MGVDMITLYLVFMSYIKESGDGEGLTVWGEMWPQHLKRVCVCVCGTASSL